MDHPSDEAIARLVQQGNTEAYGELVDRYEQKMLRYAKKFLFSHEDAQDLVQDVFIKAYTNMQSFDADRSFSSWLYRIAHNTYVNALAKKTRTPLLTRFDFDALLPMLRAPTQPDTELDKKEMRQALDACIEQIGLKYREVLVLYYFEELSYKDIAEVLHIPISTVGVRLSRGKRQLKKLYQQTYE